MVSGQSQNHFEIFGLPIAFQIDTRLLTERYRELQKKVHPDRFANASDRDRRMAVQQAADINEALAVLKSPARRARYILTLAGVSFNDENETTQEPEFLMEQMELRESLADVRSRDDPFGGITDLIQTIEQKKDKILVSLNELINVKDFHNAKTLVHKLQFFDKLLLECEATEQELADSL